MQTATPSWVLGFGAAPAKPPRQLDDGPYVPVVLHDLRAIEQRDARAGYDRHMAAARAARERGNVRAWCEAMSYASFYRSRLMSLRQQGWKNDMWGSRTNQPWRSA